MKPLCVKHNHLGTALAPGHPHPTLAPPGRCGKVGAPPFLAHQFFFSVVRAPRRCNWHRRAPLCTAGGAPSHFLLSQKNPLYAASRQLSTTNTKNQRKSRLTNRPWHPTPPASSSTVAVFIVDRPSRYQRIHRLRPLTRV